MTLLISIYSCTGVPDMLQDSKYRFARHDSFHLHVSLGVLLLGDPGDR